jgi:hypothetical protein
VRRLKAIGPAGRWVSAGEGRWAATAPKTGDGPKFRKKFFSNFNSFFRIQQNFGKLYKQI